MKKISLDNIVNEFKIDGKIISIEAYGQGHIHDTYLVVTDQGSYILQKLNTSIFKDVHGLMTNIDKITNHLKDKDIATLNIIKTKKEELYYDSYRMYDFVKGENLQETSDLELLLTLGQEFGRFVNAFNDFQGKIVDTIPNFHNSIARLRDFMQTLNRTDWSQYQEYVDFVLEREVLLTRISKAIEKGEIPLRINHNDTKLNNLIINHQYTVIDLDTVMQGSVLFDYGEAIRSSATTACEDSTDLETVKLDLQAFKALSKGFISQVALNKNEYELLVYAPLIMTLENAMRFLKDHLEGDIYFKTEFRGHNLNRAVNQLQLLKDMIIKLDDIKGIIQDIRKVRIC